LGGAGKANKSTHSRLSQNDSPVLQSFLRHSCATREQKGKTVESRTGTHTWNKPPTTGRTQEEVFNREAEEKTRLGLHTSQCAAATLCAEEGLTKRLVARPGKPNDFREGVERSKSAPQRRLAVMDSWAEEKRRGATPLDTGGVAGSCGRGERVSGRTLRAH